MAGHSRRHSVGAPLALFLPLFLLLAGTAPARSVGQTEERIKVVGHLPLPNMHVNQMFVQQRGNKHFLFLHRPNRQAFALVDVTKPDKPQLIESATLEHTQDADLPSSRAESTLAVAVTPEDEAGRNSSSDAPRNVVLHKETVRLMDLSDPKHPRTLKTFSGVTSMLPDDARHLFYLVNSDGLWVISHKETQSIPYCSSTSALMNMPNCQ